MSADLLVRCGFTWDQAAAFRIVWESDHIAPFLNEVAFAILDEGGTAEDCVDYVRHLFDYEEAVLFFLRDFTGHQAQLIVRDDKAKSNLLDRPSTGVTDLLAVDGTPRDFIVNALRAGGSPEEAERFINRYRRAAQGEPLTSQGVEDTTDFVVAEVSTLTMHMPTTACDCL